MMLEEDFSAYFDTDIFGTEAIHRPQNGAPQKVIGIFDSPYVDVYSQLSSRDYTFSTNSSAFTTEPKKGDTFTIERKQYSVLSVPEFDQTGTLLTLQLSCL